MEEIESGSKREEHLDSMLPSVVTPLREGDEYLKVALIISEEIYYVSKSDLDKDWDDMDEFKQDCVSDLDA